jgi:hypothetical protein
MRLDEKEETLWIEKLAAALNRELRLSPLGLWEDTLGGESPGRGWRKIGF